MFSHVLFPAEWSGEDVTVLHQTDTASMSTIYLCHVGAEEDLWAAISSCEGKCIATQKMCANCNQRPSLVVSISSLLLYMRLLYFLTTHSYLGSSTVSAVSLDVDHNHGVSPVPSKGKKSTTVPSHCCHC